MQNENQSPPKKGIACVVVSVVSMFVGGSAGFSPMHFIVLLGSLVFAISMITDKQLAYAKY
jgi:hypothetical protein|tara:strand:- start:231 stop:413 length:183 start_codon:yes stop_codon:yes gene_type:complete